MAPDFFDRLQKDPKINVKVSHAARAETHSAPAKR